MRARDIERHLAQLGQELADRGVQKPIRVLMILAGRQKNIEDSRALLPSVRVKTLQQARRLLDRHVSPAALASNAEAIEHAFANKYELAERVGSLSSIVPSAPPIHP